MTLRTFLSLVVFVMVFVVVQAAPSRSIYDINRLVLAAKPASEQPKLFAGDILLTPEQEEKIKFQDQMQNSPLTRWRAIAKEGAMAQRWPNNRVVYKVASSYSIEQKQTIRKALSDLAAQTCFKFVELQNSGGASDYVDIDQRGGCWSSIGRVGGAQKMSLDPECVADYVVQHEMMHALGIGHEHQRPDRDSYLTVFMQNVEKGKEHNFNRYSWNEVDTGNVRYDYESVMHYPDYAFGLNGKKTMKPKNGDFPIKYNTKVTKTDLQKLAILGGCPQKSGGSSGGGSQRNKKQKKKRTQKGRSGWAKKKTGGRKTPEKTSKKRGRSTRTRGTSMG